MVNMGRLYKELGKFLMISSNLIKLDDESDDQILDESTDAFSVDLISTIITLCDQRSRLRRIR